MSGQHWANANNFILRADAEMQRAREELENARDDSPFVAPTQKQRSSIFSNLRKLRSELKNLSQEWNESAQGGSRP